MRQIDLEQLEVWFDRYSRAFTEGDEEDRRPYLVKVEHTGRVRGNSREITAGLALDLPVRLLAEAVALLHDVGRFTQYRNYRTFRDRESVNHGSEGAAVLLREGALAGLPREQRDVIVHAVTLHNVFALPGGLDEETQLHTRLVRDADKIDIWRIFIEYYARPPAERSDVVGLSLPEADGCTPAVLDCLVRGEMVPHTLVRCQDDFKLLQLSWVYDLNFAPSFGIIARLGYIDALAATLPKNEAVRSAVERVREEVERKKG